MPLTVANNERTGRSDPLMVSTLTEGVTHEHTLSDAIDQTQHSQTSGGETQTVEVTLETQGGSLTEQTLPP